MKKLNKNWITEGLQDFEYKKYLLLGWLQWVSQNFDEVKLYPALADLIEHYRNLKLIEDSKNQTDSLIKGNLKQIDLEKLELVFERRSGNDQWSLIEKLLKFALPRLKNGIVEGTGVYEFIEKQLTFEPVGIEPIYKKEGYVFLIMQGSNTWRVYKYKFLYFEQGNQPVQGIAFEYLFSELNSYINKPHILKKYCIKNFPELPNPAAYQLYSKLQLPLAETLLPIAKRMVLHKLAA